MNQGKKDRELGMTRGITRRDFLNGVAVEIGTLGVAGIAYPSFGSSAKQSATGPYPPALTGMRGSTDSSYSVAHTLRDDAFWDSAGSPVDTHEVYDLVVAGGGISG